MKTQNSISLLSKAKILISLTMVAVLVCSMSFAISAATDPSAGYATKNTTVFSPLQLFSASTYVSGTTEAPVFNDDQYNSTVWKFSVTKDGAYTYTVLAPTEHKLLSAECYYPFESDEVTSYYKFHALNRGGNDTVKYYKTIEYIAAAGEKMSFGFTAPQSGMYEISAPISAAADANVKYAVYKTTTEGKRFCLQAEKDYIAEGKFCNIQINLTTGETFWLEASGDADTVIDIGIPQAIKYNTAVTDTNGTTYTYRVLDYFEDKDSNGIDYATGNYSPAKTSGAWDFGYFKFNGTFGTAAATFAPSDITLPAKVGDELNSTLISAMKKYEFLRNGNYYKTHDSAYVDTGKSVTSVEIPGVMVVDSANAALASATGIKTYFHSGTGATSEELTAYGNWFKFTVPVVGMVNFSSATKLANGIRMTIAVNNTVKVHTIATNDVASAISLGELNVGDEVTVLYHSIKSATANKSVTIADPVITVTGNYNTLILDADGGSESYEKYVSSGTQVTLPTPAKEGYSFLNWTDGTNTYNGGDTYTVSDDTVLTAAYESLSSTVDYDLDGDYDVDTADLVILREHLLGLIEIADDRLPYADKNSTQGIDVRDLVYIRGLIAQQA